MQIKVTKKNNIVTIVEHERFSISIVKIVILADFLIYAYKILSAI